MFTLKQGCCAYRVTATAREGWYGKERFLRVRYYSVREYSISEIDIFRVLYCTVVFISL